MGHGLSKSRITAFEQCPRRLWLQIHHPERGEYGEAQKQRLAAGNEVGDIACSLYPAGVMVEAEPNLAAALATTRRLLDEGHPGPIFEATFQHDGVLVRADILMRDGNDGWCMAEVKSSGGPKEYHLGDLATQVWVLREAGLNLTSAAIRHIYGRFVLKREGDYQGLFADAEMLDAVAEVAAGRKQVVAAARTMLVGEETLCDMGDHCSKPFTCEFTAQCGRDLAEGPEWPVTILPRGGGAKWQQQGIENLLDLDESQLSPGQAKILKATRSGEPYHDVDGATKAMAEWGWPRAWLDFETIAYTAPRWVGTKPFQQVPFQFSLHLEQQDGTIIQHDFLDLSGNDPRQACAQALVDLIPAGAQIIAYYAPFERRVLRELAASCPQHAEALLAMEASAVDLLPVTRNNWYHRDQRGSWSIKHVLPTMGDLGYAGLEVKDGGDAQSAYLEATQPDVDEIRKWALDEALRTYCQRDTWAMVVVARKLLGGSP